MKPAIATVITAANSSATHSYPNHLPTSGSVKYGSNSCPYAVTSVRNSSPKPMKMNQWATPTTVHWSILVCASVSLSMVSQRRALWSLRPTAGCPIVTTPTIVAIALANIATATTVIASDTTIATTCMGTPSSPTHPRRLVNGDGYRGGATSPRDPSPGSRSYP